MSPENPFKVESRERSPVGPMRQEYEQLLSTQTFLATKFPGFKDDSIENAKRKDRFEKTHNECTVDFYGVAHMPKTWVEQGEDLYKALENADAVLVEVTPATLSPEEAERAAESVMSVKQNWYEREELVSKFSKGVLDNTGMFFDVAAKVALAGGKRVVSADPYSGQTLVENEINTIKRFGKGIDSGVFVAKLAVGGVSASVMKDTLEKLWSDNKKPAPDTQDLKTLNRRNFLKLAGATAATTAVLGSNIGASPSVTEGESTPLDLYNRYNYRDLVVSKAVDEFTRQNPGKRLLVLYGMGHVRGIESYLDKPTVAAIKDKLYEPYKSTEEPQMYEYHHDEKGWSQEPLFVIK